MKRSYQLLAGAIILTLVISGGLYFRPLPPLNSHIVFVGSKVSSAPGLAWPLAGQSAIGAGGFGLLATSGQQTAVPMASVTKIITALVVLQKHPLGLNEPGPNLVLGPTDVSYYQDYLNQGGSVVKVVEGEQISEREALEAMLIPSANNMAESLAVWAYGSMDKFISVANARAIQLGAKNTTLADASGFLPSSVSTANDLVKIGLVAVKNPLLAQIVSEKQATVAVHGLVLSTNWLLGTDGIDGIKTGHTTEAGGCYLFSSTHIVAGQNIKLVGAVLGADSLAAAVKAAPPLLNSAAANFENVNIAKKGQTLVRYTSPWGAQSSAVAANDANILVWRGTKLSRSINLTPLHSPATKDQVVGSLNFSGGSQTKNINLMLSQKIESPTWHWRIFRR